MWKADIWPPPPPALINWHFCLPQTWRCYLSRQSVFAYPICLHDAFSGISLSNWDLQCLHPPCLSWHLSRFGGGGHSVQRKWQRSGTTWFMGKVGGGGKCICHPHMPQRDFMHLAPVCTAMTHMHAHTSSLPSSGRDLHSRLWIIRYRRIFSLRIAFAHGCAPLVSP